MKWSDIQDGIFRHHPLLLLVGVTGAFILAAVGRITIGGRFLMFWTGLFLMIHSMKMVTEAGGSGESIDEGTGD